MSARAPLRLGRFLGPMLIVGVTAVSTGFAPRDTSLVTNRALPPFHAGVFLGDQASRPDRIAGAIERFARRTGGRPALVKTFFRLDADFGAGGWAGRVVRAVDAAGATNLIALDLRPVDAGPEGLLAAVAAGRADDRLRRIARELARLDKVVLLEPAWEMNGDWDYPWQGVANGGPDAPARFIASWRRIVDVFREEGAHAVRWVFSPNIGNPVAGAGRGPDHWNWYGHYYPGDEYVDYVGAHGFHAPTLWQAPYRTFDELFDGAAADHLLSDIAARFPDKPILIGEFAAEETAGFDKGRWIAEAFASLQSRPEVAGAVWFDMDKEADWRIESSNSASSAFQHAMRHTRVAGRFSEPALRLAGR